MKLEEECWKCHGTGNHNEWGKLGQKRGHTKRPENGETIVFTVDGGCRICNGTGYTLTGFGEEIMEMVRRHLNADPKSIPEGESEPQA